VKKPCWFLGSDRNFAAERSAAPAGRDAGSGNLGSDPENARSRMSSANQTSTHFAVFRCRSVAAAGDLLFFVSPKKPKEKKGDPGACVPSLRYGQPAVLAPSGVPLELAALRQSQALIRLKLRSSAHSQGFVRRVRDRIRVKSCLCDATIFIAACARSTWARGLKHLSYRRATWFLGSDHNFAAQHPKGKPKARRIWALTPKTPESASESASDSKAVWQGRAAQRQADQGERLSEPRASSSSTPPAASSAGNPKGPDFGSPFFSLGFFGEAKKSKSPAAATERHRNSSKDLVSDSTQGFDTSARTAGAREASTSSARSFDTSGRTGNTLQGFDRLSPNESGHRPQEVKK
jgi:hypothetical protein